ncbi:MAG: UDP-N-acetylmuramate--L-alanine ligase [Oscillospiraceae bacterium]|nr:UDP-N-acetylmuramate--L-alanine ligase [Oscillospiraceae bacterium]
MEKLLNSLNKSDSIIHLIGIGGSGMYPLAQILHEKGYRLSGSDNNETDTLDAVRAMGITVHMGHNAQNVVGVDVIVRSAAIKDDNPEIVAARQSGIPVCERAELLGVITAQYDKAVCVCGTHGKTTVSSMLTYVFMHTQGDMADISAVIGGKLKILDGGSGRTGKSDVMICEACEYADTFLKLHPNVSVVLNIDEDHLEYFKTMDNLRLSFTKFCNLTTDVLVVNGDDENTMTAVTNSAFAGKVVTFGRGADNDYTPDCVSGITLKVPGEHNVLNAVATFATARTLGVPESAIASGLEAFTGAGRRFEILGTVNGITIADDYAHHPAEVTVTLKAAQSMGYKRVWAVHQPFTYSRTKRFLDEFAEALAIADKITLTEIMGGREVNHHEVSAADLQEQLAQKGAQCELFATFDEVCANVVENAHPSDLIITLGCGDVNKIAHMIIDKLNA